MNYLVIYRRQEDVYMQYLDERGLLKYLSNPEDGFGLGIEFLKDFPSVYKCLYGKSTDVWPENSALILKGDSIIVPKEKRVVTEYTLEDD